MAQLEEITARAQEPQAAKDGGMNEAIHITRGKRNVERNDMLHLTFRIDRGGIASEIQGLLTQERNGWRKTAKEMRSVSQPSLLGRQIIVERG
jgi:hypothetical protein